MVDTPLAPTMAARQTLPSPIDPSMRIAAVLFDLDGTLYSQGPVRRRMAWELALSTLMAPVGAAERLRVLRAYRRAQESIRHAVTPVTASTQIAAAAQSSGVDQGRVRELVEEWMFDRPSQFLGRYLAEGVNPLLDLLTRHGLSVGLFSDYPAARKLRGLGLAGRFSPVICATDDEIGAFKPHARGFLHACRVWGLAPAQVLYVGDRVDVDAVGAASAGMPCVVVSSSSGSHAVPAGTIVLPSLERLYRVFADGR